MGNLTDVYYEALDRGDLVVQECQACRKPIMYPKYVCPHCYSTDLGWTSVSGKGTLHSFTIQRVGAPSGFEDDLPYALGVVKLDEGVQLLARLRPDEERGWDAYKCDMQVNFDGSSPDGRHIAWFKA